MCKGFKGRTWEECGSDFTTVLNFIFQVSRMGTTMFSSHGHCSNTDFSAPDFWVISSEFLWYLPLKNRPPCFCPWLPHVFFIQQPTNIIKWLFSSEYDFWILVPLILKTQVFTMANKAPLIWTSVPFGSCLPYPLRQPNTVSFSYSC